MASSVQATPHVPKVFAHALPALRAVAFPVLIPTTFSGVADLQRDRLYVPVVAAPHHYTIEVDFAPDCHGANVCSAGSFGAFDSIYRRTNPPDLPPVTRRRPDAEDREAIRAGMLILDRPVSLRAGLTGYYTESHSAADDGGNSSLWWQDRGVEYSLITRITDRATLTRIANSAIHNGPLFPKLAAASSEARVGGSRPAVKVRE